MKDNLKLREYFLNPPVDFRPVVFWSWNEVMEPDEVRRQIGELYEAGMGGGFIHSRIGLVTEYMKGKWFEAVDAAIDETQKYGLKMYLYDEDKWPSGFSAGAVPLADKSFRMKTLIARHASQPVPDNCELIETPSYKDKIYMYTAPLGYDWFNGTCYSDLMNSKAMDCFLEQAYEPYFKRYSKYYGNIIPAEFTDEPCTIFRGNLPAGSVPYSQDLPSRFEEMHGYPPQPHYHLLFTDSPDAPKFRLDYFRTINNLFENNFSKKLGDWCKSKGIDLTGHYMCEHSMYTQQLWGTKVMANYRHQGVPGIDHLGRQIDERISAKQCQSVVNQYGKKRMISELYGCSGQNVSFEDRFWISAQQICLGVNMLNPHLSLYTMVGCRKRDFPPNIFCQQPWWPINTAIDKPLSRMCAVMSKGAYYPEALIIHPQESTFVLWQSKDDGLGQIGANYEWDWQPVTDSTKADIETLDSNLKNLMNEMLGAQRTFDFGDETIIADCGKITTSKDETVYLNIGNMSYPVIILPDMVTISLSTFELLKKFKSAGGHLVRCGKSPKMLDGKACKELDDFMQTICFVETAQIGSKMKDFLMPAVEIKNAADIENSRMLWAHIRDLPEGQRMVYLVNLDRKSEFSADISFAGKWNKAEILNIWTGEIEALCNDCQDDLLSVKLPFAQAEAKILLLSKDENYSKITKNSQPVAKVISLDNVQWDVNLLDDNSLTLDYVHYQKGNSQWSKAAVPITALQKMFNEQKYAGQLSLRYTFVKNKAVSLKNVRLVIEHPEYYQTIINGNEARYGGLGFWKDPRWSQIDISKFLVDGDNTIELNCDDFRYGDLADVENPSARYGTEIESIYIVGDFAVRSDIKADNDIPAHFNENNLPPAHIRNAAKDSFVIDKPSKLSYGDLTTQNLPFYAGRVSLKADLLSLDITSAFSQAVLKLDYMDCPCIEVKIGNESLGCLIGKMSSVDITDKIGKASQLELVFYGSLRNLLGPHHHTDKEPIFVSPESFIPHFKEQGSFAENFKKWMDNKIKPFDWLNEYYLVSFGIVSGLRIEFK